MSRTRNELYELAKKKWIDLETYITKEDKILFPDHILPGMPINIGEDLDIKRQYKNQPGSPSIEETQG